MRGHPTTHQSRVDTPRRIEERGGLGQDNDDGSGPWFWHATIIVVHCPWMHDSQGLPFEALQRRAVAGSRTVPALAAEMPAHFTAFDVLRTDEVLLGCTYSERRAAGERLFTDRSLAPPWPLR
ncbi:hypothetical protein [Streptomyces syringium]|uniref:hypothetical protein n=2 Tax=Streptomyces syringium TaxID=76729 RepID=UPI0034328C7A